MPVSVGDTVGPFEVLAPLGQGGMGEVFRARDTRLGRTVALKFLALDWRRDPDARSRLEREARAIAALSHPHICALYDIGEHDGSLFLVMECLEGETLSARLRRGPLPLTQALDLGVVIADALALAHRAGIVHRDLKPANIMLTARGPKLLDFGVAKLSPRADSGEATTAWQTASQSVLGTLPYMAPEQLRHDEVDHRADIFAFGVVLFEAITGRRPFTARTSAELIGAILNDAPAPLEPPAVDHLVRTCLAKDPDERWRSIHDVGVQLKWLRAQPVSTPPAAVSRPSRRLLVGAAALATVVVAGAAWLGGSFTRNGGLVSTVPQPALSTPARLSITLDRGQSFGLKAQPSVDISPDGTTVAFVANRDGISQLFIRRLDQAEATPLADTAGATVPFFSPDGQWVGFAADGRLRKIGVGGGAPVTLCDALELTGADWIDSQTIVFTPNSGDGLWLVSSGGGVPTPLTTLDRSANETSHRWPQLDPEGQVLFTASGSGFNRLESVNLQSKARRVVLDKAYSGRYLRPDLLLFGRGRQLFTIGVDAAGRPLAQTPVPVRETPFSTGTGAPFLAVSNDGTLVYLPAESDGSRRSLAWLDRTGAVEPLAAPRRKYQHPQISPDGRRIAVSIVDGANRDLWIYDIPRASLTPLTTDGKSNGVSAWSPDGGSLLFSSGRDGGGTNVVRIRADGSGPRDRLSPQPYSQWPGTWLPDGTATFMQFSPESLGDILAIDMAGGPVRPLVALPGTQWGGRVSANSQWLSYVSNQSGTFETFIAKMSDPSRRWQVSQGGGHEVVWSRTGLEVFFRTDNALMAVAISPDAEVPVGPARRLFERPFLYEPSGPGLPNYDVGPDGRFLIIERDDAADSLELRVVFNWISTLTPQASPAP